jgi:hypothetical protein
MTRMKQLFLGWTLTIIGTTMVIIGVTGIVLVNL